MRSLNRDRRKSGGPPARAQRRAHSS
jgi:hypothetical protein